MKFQVPTTCLLTVPDYRDSAPIRTLISVLPSRLVCAAASPRGSGALPQRELSGPLMGQEPGQRRLQAA